MKINELLNIIKAHNSQPMDGRQGDNYTILIPIVEQDDQLHVLFEVRAKHLQRQPGDICFPGGKVDETDATFKDAAIRETFEELGVAPHHVVDVYPFDYLIGHLNLYPFVGRLLNPEAITPHPDEVDAVFMMPLDVLLEMKPLEYVVELVPHLPEDFPFDLIPGGRKYPWFPRKVTQYFYLYEDKVIWGLTAHILHHFLEVLRMKATDA
ncbi:MAG: CoA pyrophosphatase [Defluviitaleaceae bacterium]|nr:CoA pyrophosphatase [Defluviitaleaceae bacterium]